MEKDFHNSHFYLCLAFNLKSKTCFGGAACGKVFHPVYFTAFHNWGNLKQDIKMILDITLNHSEGKSELNKP